MARDILPPEHIHSAIQSTIANWNRDIVDEVKAAIARHDVLVVGMAQNPFPRRARKLLKQRGIAFEYLEYGSYLRLWRRRSALKMWTGWPTFPMIFVKGTLIGGTSNLKSLAESGELDKLLAAR